MAFSSVLPFLLPTHSVDCAVHLLLSHSRALLVSSALFHPFTALKCPFDGPFTALKCPFDGPFTALFRWHPALLKTWAEHGTVLVSSKLDYCKLSFSQYCTDALKDITKI